MESRKYDLTSLEGVKKAYNELSPQKKMLFAAMGGPMAFYAQTVKIIFDKLMSSDIPQQIKAVEDLIKRGKEQNVDEMELTVRNIKGFKLNIPMEEAKIDTVIGHDEKMTIKVKYK